MFYIYKGGKKVCGKKEGTTHKLNFVKVNESYKSVFSIDIVPKYNGSVNNFFVKTLNFLTSKIF